MAALKWNVDAASTFITQQQLCLAYPSFEFQFRGKTENHSLSIITRHYVQTINTEGFPKELKFKGNAVTVTPKSNDGKMTNSGPALLNFTQGNIKKNMQSHAKESQSIKLIRKLK